jgi:hypothetical protein
MGREIRRVPPNWKHPEEPIRYSLGYQYPMNSPGMQFVPLYNGDYRKEASEWLAECLRWANGKHERQSPEHENSEYEFYWDYAGNPPSKENYVDYGGVEPTWYQVYETVSEGTPVTPPFETKEELADYLVKNGDNWDQRRGTGGWSPEAAARFVGSGYAPSMVVIPGRGIIEPRNMDKL